MSNKICVVGIWHLGCVVSACLADLGYLVVGVDRDPKKVENLNNGVPPLFEPGLEQLLISNLNSKRLSYTTDLSQAVKDSSYVLITFDTPVSEKDEVDLSEIFAAAKELAQCLENGTTIIVSSQVPVGTCEQIKAMIKQSNPQVSLRAKRGNLLSRLRSLFRVKRGISCSSLLRLRLATATLLAMTNK